MLALRKITMALAILGLVATSSVTAAPLPEPKAVTLDETKWLLSDAELFVKVNIKQVMASKLMANQGKGLLKDAIKNNEQLKGIIDATGLDLTKDIETIIASASGNTPKDGKLLVVIRGSFNQTKIHDTLKKVAEKQEKLKLVKEGTTQIYEIENNQNPMFAAFVDKNTIIVTHSKEATVDGVKNGGKKAAKISKDMKAALAKFTGKESITFAMIVNDEIKKAFQNIPNAGADAAKLQTTTASITLTDAVTLNVAGITGEAKSAKGLENLLVGFQKLGALMEGLPGVVVDILNATKITSTKEAVNIDLKITKEMIEKAAKGGN